MISAYLNRPLRERAEFVLNRAIRGRDDWARLCDLAMTLDVMVAVISVRPDADPVFECVGGAAKSRTGYAAERLAGASPALLEGDRPTGFSRRLLCLTEADGRGDLRILGRKPTGQSYSCHVGAISAGYVRGKPKQIFAVFSENPFAEAPPPPQGSQMDDHAP